MDEESWMKPHSTESLRIICRTRRKLQDPRSDSGILPHLNGESIGSSYAAFFFSKRKASCPVENLHPIGTLWCCRYVRRDDWHMLTTQLPPHPKGKPRLRWRGCLLPPSSNLGFNASPSFGYGGHRVTSPSPSSYPSLSQHSASPAAAPAAPILSARRTVAFLSLSPLECALLAQICSHLRLQFDANLRCRTGTSFLLVLGFGNLFPYLFSLIWEPPLVEFGSGMGELIWLVPFELLIRLASFRVLCNLEFVNSLGVFIPCEDSAWISDFVLVHGEFETFHWLNRVCLVVLFLWSEQRIAR